jgi:hypothetical protein
MTKTRAAVRSVQVAALAAVFGVVGALSASAEPEDPTATAIEGGFADLQDLFLTTIAPAIFALVLAIIGVTFGIRKLRQNTK